MKNNEKRPKNRPKSPTLQNRRFWRLGRAFKRAWKITKAETLFGYLTTWPDFLLLALTVLPALAVESAVKLVTMYTMLRWPQTVTKNRLCHDTVCLLNIAACVTQRSAQRRIDATRACQQFSHVRPWHDAGGHSAHSSHLGVEAALWSMTTCGYSYLAWQVHNQWDLCLLRWERAFEVCRVCVVHRCTINGTYAY